MRACTWCGGARLPSPSRTGWGCLKCGAYLVLSRVPQHTQVLPVFLAMGSDEHLQRSPTRDSMEG